MLGIEHRYRVHGFLWRSAQSSVGACLKDGQHAEDDEHAMECLFHNHIPLWQSIPNVPAGSVDFALMSPSQRSYATKT